MGDGVKEVVPGVFRLGNRFVNWWLVQDGDSFTLIDAGLPRHLGQLDRCLGETGRSLADVDACLLTHADIDHIGVAEHLRRMGTQILIHPDDESAARGAARPLARRADRQPPPALPRQVHMT